MNCNQDLLIQILKKTESILSYNKIMLYIDDLVTEEYDENTISNHIQLLLDYGYVEATTLPLLGCTYENFIIHRITASGYDYLDTVR